MSFKDIRGQDNPIQILREHMRQSRLMNGYLFVGPEGVGKSLVAKTFAKTLNCGQESLDSCDSCASCLKIEKNQHPDVHINRKENSDSIKIESIRQLQKDISLKPYEGKFKVFIIDEAHSLTAEASNALLKILEEPPKMSLIILVSSKPVLLFKTIISRCQILKFYALERNLLREVLIKDYNLKQNLAHFLAYFCEGRIGYALRLKDLDIMRDKNRVIDQFLTSTRFYQKELSILEKGQMRNYLNILSSWFRDIYLMKVGMPSLELINLDRKDELLKVMKIFSFTDLDAIFKFISDALFYLEQNINVRLLMSNLKMEISRG